MGWPIPEIPEKSTLPAPRFGRWFIILIAMMTIGSLSALFIGRFSTYTPVLLYGALPGFLLWLCIFGVVLNRHDQSGASAYSWHEESVETKSQWQHWSRKQLVVAANVLLTPEAEGVGSILGSLSEIPMFPLKARPLCGEKVTLPSLLNMIATQLEEQTPEYRHYLYTVYILCSSVLNRETIKSSVYNQWQLRPEFINSIEELNELNFENKTKGLTLILCLQYWPENRPQKSSEFISAQLRGAREFIVSHKYSVMAGVGRIMPLSPGYLADDLKMLFDYNKLSFNELEHVWLSGDIEDISAAVSIYAESHGWLLPRKKPVHYLDLSFGPPGELAFALSLSMMVEAANKTSQNQLIIYQQSQSSGWLCLITRELFS